jgi:hypothetical protein
VGPDGTAAVNQAAVFAVSRPLQEALITYELALGIGPRSPPLLVVAFQFSLLRLIKRSPLKRVTWEEWRQVARCTCQGLQVGGSCLSLMSHPAVITVPSVICCLQYVCHFCQLGIC